MERLARAEQAPALPDEPAEAAVEGSGLLAAVAGDYLALFAEWRDGPVVPERAPVSDDALARTHDLTAACHFMDADLVGIAPLEAGDRGHAWALVILVEHGRLPEADNLAYGWSADGRAAAATLRAGEIALVAAGYIRQLGWPACAHFERPARSTSRASRCSPGSR